MLRQEGWGLLQPRSPECWGFHPQALSRAPPAHSALAVGLSSFPPEPLHWAARGSLRRGSQLPPEPVIRERREVMESFITCSHRPPWESEGGLPQGVSTSRGLIGAPWSLAPTLFSCAQHLPSSRGHCPGAMRPELPSRGLPGWCSLPCLVGPMDASRTGDV